MQKLINSVWLITYKSLYSSNSKVDTVECKSANNTSYVPKCCSNARWPYASNRKTQIRIVTW